MSRLSIRSAARPFVARALRGHRGRRLLGLSVLLAALSGALGTWLALGTGQFERELRVGLNIEEPRYRQEAERFVLIADSEEEAEALRREVQRRAASPEEPEEYTDEVVRVRGFVDSGVQRLGQASVSNAPTTRWMLQRRAREAYEAYEESLPQTSRVYAAYGFDWWDEHDVRALRAVLERGMVPGVEVYASPLGPLDALRLAGVLAGATLLLLLLLAAPVLAGTQMAQETHENTLQPLAGSALRAEELALGLTSGPLAIVGVLAAPQLALLLTAAAVTGSLSAAVAAVGSALAGAAFLVMLSQLAGLALGKVRSPGLVGGGLAAVLGVLGGVGVALAAGTGGRTAGVLALLPQAAASHELAQAFGLWGEVPSYVLATNDTAATVAIGALGMLSLAFLGLRALARRIGNTAPAALRGPEALFGAIVAMVLVTTANPMRDPWRAEEFYLLNLGVLAVPMAILLMMRAPTGDVPPALRRTPVAALVGEFVGWAALYLLAASVIVGPGLMWLFHSPVALAYTGWFLVVSALLSLRVAVAPLTLASRVWVGVCAAMLMVAFGEAVVWCRDAALFRSADTPLFAFSALSPLLGAVQAGLTIAVPWTLLRALRRPATVAAPAA